MKPTLFSVSYAGLWGQDSLDVAGFIRKASQLGYPAVELMGKRPHLSIVDVTDEQLDAIAGEADKCGVQIATIAGYTDFTSGASAAEVPFVEMQIAYVRELSRIAKRLGAKIVRTFTGYSTSEESYRDDWDKCVTAVRECSAVAAEFDVVLGLQNHHDVGVNFAAFGEFLNDVDHPNCKAMFDPWSAAIHGEDLRACARQMAPKMVQTTLADYVRLPRYAYMPGLVNYRRQADMLRAVTLGEGFIDQAEFFAGLKEGGFDGYVAYEMCSPLRGGGSMENLDAVAAASLKKINKLIGNPPANEHCSAK